MKRELERWARLAAAIGIPFSVATPFIVWAPRGAEHSGITLLMVIAFLTIAMGGSMLGLQLHWKWHMRRGQRDFEREQDDRMAREMTVEQLAQAAFEGRFPYNAGKAWDR